MLLWRFNKSFVLTESVRVPVCESMRVQKSLIELGLHSYSVALAPSYSPTLSIAQNRSNRGRTGLETRPTILRP